MLKAKVGHHLKGLQTQHTGRFGGNFFIDLSGQDNTNIVFRISLILLIFFGFSDGFFSDTFPILALVPLAFPRLIASQSLWFFLAIISITSLLHSWAWADNHKYLTVYWICTLGVVAHLKESEQFNVMKKSSHTLLFICMFFAVVQKTISPTYLSGDFFEYQLLIDRRFELLLKTFAGLSDIDMVHNQSALRSVLGDQNLDIYQLRSNSKVEMLAQILTWVNYIEQLLFCFLIPLARFKLMNQFKHSLLLIFILGTYAIAPVIGFGWLICILGYCMCRVEQLFFKVSYLAVGFIIFSYHFLGNLFQTIGGF